MTPRQQAFCREYLIDLNGTKAAIRAGYSAKTANREAARLLSNVDIQKKISGLMSARSESLDIDAQTVLRALVEMAMMDVADLYDEHKALKPVEEWPEAWRRNVVAIEHKELLGDSPGLLTKVKFPDKLKVWELIGRHIRVSAFENKAQADTKAKLDNLAKLFELAAKGHMDAAQLAKLTAEVIG